MKFVVIYVVFASNLIKLSCLCCLLLSHCKRVCYARPPLRPSILLNWHSFVTLIFRRHSSEWCFFSSHIVALHILSLNRPGFCVRVVVAVVLFLLWFFSRCENSKHLKSIFLLCVRSRPFCMIKKPKASLQFSTFWSMSNMLSNISFTI